MNRQSEALSWYPRVNLNDFDIKFPRKFALPVGRESVKGFPTKRPSHWVREWWWLCIRPERFRLNRTGSSVMLDWNVSKWRLLKKRFWSSLLSYRLERDRTKGCNLLIINWKNEGIFLRHCTYMAVTHRVSLGKVLAYASLHEGCAIAIKTSGVATIWPGEL